MSATSGAAAVVGARGRRGAGRVVLLRVGLLVASLVSLLRAAPLGAQSEQSDRTADGALAITADELRRHIEVLAHDSMRGRDTPSPELDQTAQYVANQFKQLGLWPALPGPFGQLPNPSVDSPSLATQAAAAAIQSYPVPGSGVVSEMTLIIGARLTHGGTSVITEQGEPVFVVDTALGRAAVDSGPESGGRSVGSVVLLTGRHTPASVERARLTDNIVLYLPAPQADSVERYAVVEALRATSNVIIMADEDSATFAARRAATRAPVVVDRLLEGGARVYRWAVYVWPGALDRYLRGTELDLAALRADTTPRVRVVPNAGVWLTPRVQREGHGLAPNVAALLPGTDPALRDRFVVITAHMDHTGMSPGRGDSVHNNGAHDNASGVAGLLALAKAFSQPGARPKRSILFLATSGGAKGKDQWGAHAFFASPFVESRIVVNVTLDMIGRAPGDSLVVTGLSDYDFVTRPDWVAAQHPELGVHVVDGGTSVTAVSDHVAFIQRGLPSLYIHAGTHDDGEADVADTPAAVDAAQEARLVRLIYYMTRSLASEERRPRWTSASRALRSQLFGN